MEIRTSWSEVVAEAPAFAERVATAFRAGTNKTLATLRADGSPRISGTELEFVDGRVTLGMMPRSRKLADVLRDPRVALHSPTLEPSREGTLDAGDAKLAGVLVAFPDPANPTGTSFELDITDVVLTTVDEERKLLVVESWHPGRGYERLERE
jgi:hypothetical protein